VFKERMNCKEFNDAISTAAVIFLLLHPLALPGLERNLSSFIWIYTNCPSILLEELENHKHISLPKNLNWFFRNVSSMVYIWVTVFIISCTWDSILHVNIMYCLLSPSKRKPAWCYYVGHGQFLTDCYHVTVIIIPCRELHSWQTSGK